MLSPPAQIGQIHFQTFGFFWFWLLLVNSVEDFSFLRLILYSQLNFMYFIYILCNIIEATNGTRFPGPKAICRFEINQGGTSKEKVKGGERRGCDSSQQENMHTSEPYEKRKGWMQEDSPITCNYTLLIFPMQCIASSSNQLFSWFYKDVSVPIVCNDPTALCWLSVPSGRECVPPIFYKQLLEESSFLMARILLSCIFFLLPEVLSLQK